MLIMQVLNSFNVGRGQICTKTLLQESKENKLKIKKVYKQQENKKERHLKKLLTYGKG